MKNKVYAVRCSDYGQVETKMSELLAMMGGMARFVAPEEKIVMKVNLLMPAEPERAITTHPEVVASVGRLAKDVGAQPVIVDSPGSGFPYNRRTLEQLYATCKMDAAAEKAAVELNFDTSFEGVSFPDAGLTKHFDVISPVIYADGVLNLCKLKTHTFMGMTGAVKNHFGIIPGLAKPGYHAKLHDTQHFADMLLDLALYTAPRLSIMDAVVGMEGNGPNSGTPRKIGWLLASESPLALDVVANEIVGLSWENNPVLVAAARRGLQPARLEQVELIGADIADLRMPGYKLPDTIVGGTGFGAHMPWWQKAIVPLYRDGLTLRPKVIRSKCVACGACVKACPAHAIKFVGDGKKYAHIDNRACIRCYCCHEMCSQDAIDLRGNLLYRMLMRG